jgi:hypothetical protein
MAISVVNGFVCTSSCDVAKAKKGEDPHPNLHAGDLINGQREPDGVGGSKRLDGPAVLFGGSLTELTPAQVVTGVAAAGQADPASLRRPGSSVDVLV